MARRGMDWPTAWSALVPVYGLAAVLHAILPLFAALVWIIFLFYGLKVLDGARLAEDPWRGRGSPRLYLFTFAVVMVIHLGSFAAAFGSTDARSTATALVTLPIPLGLAAWFVARTAPPGTRNARGWLAIGVSSELAGALTAPIYVLGNFPTTGALPTLGVVASVGLAVGSVAAFSLASRERGRPPVVARKVARE